MNAATTTYYHAIGIDGKAHTGKLSTERNRTSVKRFLTDIKDGKDYEIKESTLQQIDFTKGRK